MDNVSSSGNHMYPSPSIQSPVSGYKKSLADSTISDAELESQISFSNVYSKSYGYYGPTDGEHHLMCNPEMVKSEVPGRESPQRMSLDERINSVLYPPDQMHYQQQQPMYNYPPDPAYQQSQYPYHQPPPPLPQQNEYYPQNYYNKRQYQHQSFVNNSNLVSISSRGPPITKPQSSKNQVVQVGNVLEIVPTKMPPESVASATLAEQESPSDGPKPLTVDQIRELHERKAELKLKKLQDREKKREEKGRRKEKIKLELKRLLEKHVNEPPATETSDEENEEMDQKKTKEILDLLNSTYTKGILKANNGNEYADIYLNIYCQYQ
jgi:hypothetical protein